MLSALRVIEVETGQTHRLEVETSLGTAITPALRLSSCPPTETVMATDSLTLEGVGDIHSAQIWTNRNLGVDTLTLRGFEAPPPPQSVPEPGSSLLLLGTALAGLAGCAWRWRP